MRSGVQCEESREEVVLGNVMREQMVVMLSDCGGLDSRICRQLCHHPNYRGFPHWEAGQTHEIATPSLSPDRFLLLDR
jgi:hypothetical protein